MKYLIYISTSTSLLPEVDLLEILNVSRERNPKRNITGVLLYCRGTFIQVLEGTPEDVDVLYAEVEGDKRHSNVIKLIDEPLTERNFPEWTMGFSSVDADLKDVLGYIESVDEIVNSKKEHYAIDTLKNFIEVNRVSLRAS